MTSNAELIADAREFRATSKLGKSMVRELDKAMIYIRRLVNAVEFAEARIDELEAEAKEYRIERIRRIGELQELAEAEARIAELDAGEWEHSWEGETEDGSWLLAQVFSCVEDAQAFAESTSGAWVKRDGGRMVKRHVGPWVPVESEVGV